MNHDDRKRHLTTLADYAEELGLADVAEMLRHGCPQPDEQDLKPWIDWRLRASLCGHRKQDYEPPVVSLTPAERHARECKGADCWCAGFPGAGAG